MTDKTQEAEGLLPELDCDANQELSNATGRHVPCSVCQGFHHPAEEHFETQLRKDKDLLEGEDGSLGLYIEQQQAALQLAEEALDNLVDISVCSCSIGDEFRTDHHENCDWMKVQAALTAIKKLKGSAHE